VGPPQCTQEKQDYQLFQLDRWIEVGQRRRVRNRKCRESPSEWRRSAGGQRKDRLRRGAAERVERGEGRSHRASLCTRQALRSNTVAQANRRTSIHISVLQWGSLLSHDLPPPHLFFFCIPLLTQLSSGFEAVRKKATVPQHTLHICSSVVVILGGCPPACYRRENKTKNKNNKKRGKTKAGDHHS
jgi:hypothetical protein